MAVSYDFDKQLEIGESQLIEFKTSFQEDTLISLVAFANHKGGTVYIGVSDKGEVLGLTLGKETIQKWLNDIKIKTQPSIIPNVIEIDYKGKTIVAIQVQEFPVKPVSYKGRYYKRVNNANHQLTPIEITNLNLQSLQLSWDAYEKPHKTIEDLSVEKIEKFIVKVNKTGRFHLPNDWKDSLQKLNLIREDKITNAAWLLFSNQELEYNIHIGRFKTASLIIDDNMLRGTLFEVVEETMKYIISHIKVAFEITGKTAQRTEIFEYPLPALRELVLYTIIHRDYLSPIDIQIKIFDHSIVFYNPGGLFGNLTLEQLKQDDYQAQTRNKLIAEAFYLIGEIEKYGSGFLRIRDEIKSYPTMELLIDNAPNGLMTSLKYSQQKTTDEFTDSMIKIIELVRKNPKISLNKMAENMGITKRGCDYQYQ
ncbi:MAG: ATP-dependent DNA helicase [Bacteroidia bacterium]|nr:MAG: ATP-dependent DNA helicase [Bacteroidia bacterium]